MALFRKLLPAEQAPLLSVLVPVLIALTFFIWGLFIFYAVGNKGPYPWYYGSVDEVPGQSPYSTSFKKQFFMNATSPEKGGKVTRQHVMGEAEDPTFLPEARIDGP